MSAIKELKKRNTELERQNRILIATINDMGLNCYGCVHHLKMPEEHPCMGCLAMGGGQFYELNCEEFEWLTKMPEERQ